MLYKAESQRFINTVQRLNQRAIIPDDARRPDFEIHPPCRRFAACETRRHQRICQTVCNLIFRQITFIRGRTNKLFYPVCLEFGDQLCCQHTAFGNTFARQLMTVRQNKPLTMVYIKGPELH